jgi:arylformamidase
MIYKYLSYPFASVIPVYGGLEAIRPGKINSIQNGDSANTFVFTLQNHWGTHVDAPNHFFEQGKRIVDYVAGFWVFLEPQVICFDLKPSELLALGDWLNELNKETDLLLFKACWSSQRDKDVYHSENPGIHPDVAFYLRKNFPRLRAIGIDWISVSAYQHREMGRMVHRAFLDPQSDSEPILIIEDMDLSGDLTNLLQVEAFPLRMTELDSAPCTVIGMLNDKSNNL